jgi:flavin reductase (DIM6/NTAB) family NADH-FMN oxidoreductase RutF
MECKLYSSVDVGVGGAGSSTVVIGEIVKFHIAQAAYQNGAIAVEALEPVSRLGGIRYALVGDMFDIERPLVGSGSSGIS